MKKRKLLKRCKLFRKKKNQIKNVANYFRREMYEREFDRYGRNESIDYIQEKRRTRPRYRRSNVPYRGK